MLQSNFQISPVTVNNLDALRNISIQTFTETFSDYNSEENMRRYISENFSVPKLTAEFQNPGSSFYLISLKDSVIGYLKLNRGAAQTEPNENALEIERIYVQQEFHGKKVGLCLFEKAKTIATENHYDYIWLGVWEKNTKAIAFYRKLGFMEYDQHVFVLGSDEQTDIMMKLNLI
ncbi:MAG: N-acetyltransferase [Bacteroidetes bacterium]|jgi:ribosomal protein S18 acetylase RimI-like enzyme|nr:N-acetyltransferase [Bacteroidota bacterium]MDF2451135.1 N-acetyltransferase [Bacteroidota bacterium]